MTEDLGPHTFERGDSNRCRNAYEKILHAALPPRLLDVHKKNKHISVGRCRMVAINHRVALPAYDALSHAGFDYTKVSPAAWSVPDDCKRFVKKIAEEGLCRMPCATCDRLGGAPVAPAHAGAPAHATAPAAARTEGLTTRGQSALSAKRAPVPVELTEHLLPSAAVEYHL